MTAPWKGLDPDPLYVPGREEHAPWRAMTPEDWDRAAAIAHRKRRDRETAADYSKGRMLGGYLVAAAIVVLVVLAVVLLVGRGS